MRLLIIPFLFIYGLSFGQPLDRADLKHDRTILRRALRAPENLSFSTYFLSQYLTEPAKSDLDKVRSFYVWIAHNITYDMKGFKSNNLPDYLPKAVLHNNLAVCEGYANLFKALCDEAGIRAEVINGYSKGYGYVLGQKFTVSNHSWNAVYLDNEWKLIDVTWAAINTNESVVKREFTYKYFLTDPQLFIEDHLPEIPAWQLLNHPIKKDDFEQGKFNFNNGNYNYRDTLASILTLKTNERTISYQLQVRSFNPSNENANYNLGVEYRFMGLDLLEAVYTIENLESSKYDELKGRSFEAFDNAAFYFSLIKPGSRYYESAMIFLDDTDFERGVFLYEVAHRMMEIFNSYPLPLREKKQDFIESAILRNYREAAIYFRLIPQHSWYYSKAQDYLNNYLSNPFKE